MRRTKAPSQMLACKSPSAGNENKRPFPEAFRSTSQLLNLLSDNYQPQFECSIPEDCTTPEIEEKTITNVAEKDNKPRKMCFSVVWGKQTQKKHKTWQGDGVLFVENNVAILKDENGALLGRSSKIDPISLEEGSRLLVGSKEVEIVDACYEKNLSEVDINRQPISSDKVNKGKFSSDSNICFKNPFKRLKANSSHFVSPFHKSDVDCLAMPKPDSAHQWKFNVKQLPVTDVKLDLFLTRLLRPHQQQGVLFLYSCISGIRDSEFTGAILADEMGLGKTLQCIALIWMLLKTGPYGAVPLVQRVLIVTPGSLVVNWFEEFKRWLTFQRLKPFLINQKQKPSDYTVLPHNSYPVMIISYEMLMRHYDEVKLTHFDLLICDEGHRLKNTQSRIWTMLSQLEIGRRILLTGTPVQNDLQEFFALIEFVNPGIVGTYATFRKYFESPIIASNQPECSDETKELGDARSRELNHRTNSFILRRTQSIINQYLPSKQECVIFCAPSALQIELYGAVISLWENNGLECSKLPHLNIIMILQKICNHPQSLIKMDEVPHHTNENNFICGVVEKTVSDHLQYIFRKYVDLDELESTSKIMILDKFLLELKSSTERVVLISHFTQTLDLFENLCRKRQHTFLRLDGSTLASTRHTVVEKFNASDSKYFIFLLSAKAGGLGLNLIGASRLILFDSDWNPASDLQAMSRIWREGQKKDVYIYRFLTSGSIEEKIFQRQISKTTLRNKVVDTQFASNIRLSNEELKEIFRFFPDCPSLTHEMLCECKGDGLPLEISNNAENDANDDSERDFQLNILNQQKRKDNFSQTALELTKWQHFSAPIAESLLEELCLKLAAEHVAFIFRNKFAESI